MSLLSIIIPVYNAEKTIEWTLDSLSRIAEESKKSAEVVIVNDGSQDRSMEIVESKRKGLSPLDFKIVKQANLGSAAARNTGLEHCNGEWIFFLDADDELAFDPVYYINEYPHHSSLAFSIQWVKKFKSWKVLQPSFITPETHLDVCTALVPFSLSNIIFRKDRITHKFDKEYVYLEDWVFWIKNPLIFENMMIKRKVISAYIHAHGENKSSHYSIVGGYREKFAGEMLESFGKQITGKQRNNLLIQAQIGQILQGKKIRFNNFVRFPCDMTLYGKLIIYAVLRSRFPKFDVYGS